MAKIKIVVFPGTNREKDMADAFERVSGTRPDFIWHQEKEIGASDLIVLPGGFSHGDYLRCGAMAAHSPIMKEVIKKANAGTPILGVCNGFQTLIESGLLPGALLKNNHLKFNCKRINLRVETNDNNFLGKFNKGDILPEIPVAHGDGNYFVTADQLNELQDNDCVALKYCSPNGALSDRDNPNGSSDHIAGVFNKEKTILGFMPHPENAVDPLHGGTGGLKLFEGIVEALN